ncbi:MAG: MOSC domain-containing protein [Ktedonobacteraceae bacterium]|nr:MOSC domain-containing protein [Ktedonobacteraceae bacterium]
MSGKAYNTYWEGEVVAIYIAPAADVPMQALEEARLVEGRGIEGDRYYLGTGTHSNDGEPCYEVTLVESEAIEALQHEYKIDCQASTPRRNIVTRGFSLNHLVDREFTIGEVRLRGIALREPCPHLIETTHHKIAVGLMHRGGLGAKIVSGGTIRQGDRISEVQ